MIKEHVREEVIKMYNSDPIVHKVIQNHVVSEIDRLRKHTSMHYIAQDDVTQRVLEKDMELILLEVVKHYKEKSLVQEDLLLTQAMNRPIFIDLNGGKL
jgi:hypothetical protein